jgi:hypothetical protein
MFDRVLANAMIGMLLVPCTVNVVHVFADGLFGKELDWRLGAWQLMALWGALTMLVMLARWPMRRESEMAWLKSILATPRPDIPEGQRSDSILVAGAPRPPAQ